jgi:hypothetical protein
MAGHDHAPSGKRESLPSADGNSQTGTALTVGKPRLGTPHPTGFFVKRRAYQLRHNVHKHCQLHIHMHAAQYRTIRHARI